MLPVFEIPGPKHSFPDPGQPIKLPRFCIKSSGLHTGGVGRYVYAGPAHRCRPNRPSQSAKKFGEKTSGIMNKILKNKQAKNLLLQLQLIQILNAQSWKGKWNFGGGLWEREILSFC
jgi:hypothetical protein